VRTRLATRAAAHADVQPGFRIGPGQRKPAAPPDPIPPDAADAAANSRADQDHTACTDRQPDDPPEQVQPPVVPGHAILAVGYACSIALVHGRAIEHCSRNASELD